MKEEEIFLNPLSRYEKMKPYLIDEFVLVYGQEYRDYITKKLNNTLCVLTSNPTETYLYATSLGTSVSKKEIKKLKDENKKFLDIEAIARKYGKDMLKLYLIENGFLPSKISSKIDVLSPFMDGKLNSSLIDSFDSYSKIMLHDSNIPSYVKKSIEEDQNKYYKKMKQLGIYNPITDSEKIDDLIDYRSNLKNAILKKIVSLSSYCQKIKQDFTRISSIEISDTILYSILYKINASKNTIALQTRLIRNNESYSLVYAPIIEMKNINPHLSLDGFLNHELVHAIESDKKVVGISIFDKNNSNDFLNEIRTERIAAKVTESLHSKGYRMFDNEKIKFNYYQNADYAFLFFVFNSFLEENEDLFNRCAITHDLSLIYEKYNPEYLEELSTYAQNEINNMYDFYRKNGINAKYEISSELMNLLNNPRTK